MISFKQFLFLERPIDVYKELYQYKDRDDLFISFTEINKVGINPKTDYFTPGGIYTYPLKQFWETYDVDKNKSVGGSAPYAGEKEFVHLIQCTDSSNIITVDNYNETDLNKDIEKIKSLAEDIPKDKELEILYKVLPLYIDRYVIMQYKKDNLTSEQIIDNVLKERPDDIYSVSQDLKIADLFKLSMTMLMEASKHNARRTDYPLSRLMYITGLLSTDKSKYTKRFGPLSHGRTKISFRWSNILRFLGHEGISDKYAQGIIHPNEPLQTLFLSMKTLKQLKTFVNNDINRVENTPNFRLMYEKNQSIDGIIKSLESGNSKNVLSDYFGDLSNTKNDPIKIILTHYEHNTNNPTEIQKIKTLFNLLFNQFSQSLFKDFNEKIVTHGFNDSDVIKLNKLAIDSFKIMRKIKGIRTYDREYIHELAYSPIFLRYSILENLISLDNIIRLFLDNDDTPRIKKNEIIVYTLKYALNNNIKIILDDDYIIKLNDFLKNTPNTEKLIKNTTSSK